MHDPDTLIDLLRAAGFHDVAAAVQTSTLRLPAPAEFLWQYINLTPMGPLVVAAPETAQQGMERQVVERWRPFVAGGQVRVDQPMVIASGRA